MADLLLELFSEEIPARMQKDALAHLSGALERIFPGKKAAGFVTPRRLAVIIKDLPAAQADVDSELKGPKIGAPEQAMQGFLKKCGLPKEKLIERDGVYIAKIFQKGRPTAEVLKDAIEDILKNFPWPKSMRWGSNDTTWVRPLHSILCIFDGKIVPVEFAGINAGNTTRGHRFLTPDAITITNADEYEGALQKAHVIADREKRKAEIKKQAEEAAAKAGMKLREDEGLLEEVTGLVEWPVVLTGTIDKQYMDLPPEVLVSEMRAHQKYFALEIPSPQRGEAGRGASGESSRTTRPHPNPPPPGEGISPHFLITANMVADDGGKAIVAGNERVLKARLADGRFFWDQDRKKKLEDWAKGLSTVTFHAKLGTVANKVGRIKALAVAIYPRLERGSDAAGETPARASLGGGLIERAASLCKADLVTGMVGEFPDLQGVMGRYYATAQKETPEVADAIRDHYKPQGPSDAVPTAPVSICVALADKLDTLVSMFAIGEKPTGSKDPFALRRAALGVIRIILENNIRLPLRPLFAAAPAKDIALHMTKEKLEKKTEARLHEPHKVGKYLAVNESASTDLEEAVPANLADTLYEFFIDRLIVQLKDSGIRHDVIKAVVANGDDDLVRIVARAKAVQAFLDTEDGSNLLAGYKRAANIVAIEEKKDKAVYRADELKNDILDAREEKALASILSQFASEIGKLLQAEKYTDAMKLLTNIKNPVGIFFDNIMVNVKDNDALRANRLRLLAGIRSCMDNIADFSKIEDDRKEQKKVA